MSIAVPEGLRARYSLDGTRPGESAPYYADPVVLSGTGLRELRYVVEKADGTPLPWIFGELYDVR